MKNTKNNKKKSFKGRGHARQTDCCSCLFKALRDLENGVHPNRHKLRFFIFLSKGGASHKAQARYF
jgi:hypothetical protein